MILFLLVIALVILSFIANYFHKYSLIFIIISAIIVLSCYFFIARYIHTPDSFIPAKQIQIYPLLGNYYNLLTESFKQGNMYIVDDTELQFLKDPNIYKTFPYYVNKNSNLNRDLLDTLRGSLAKMGAAHDVYSMCDLMDEEICERYTLFIFPILFEPNEAILRIIEKLKNKGKYILFLYAPAYKSGKSTSRITGINIVETDMPLGGINYKNTKFAFTNEIVPCLYADDKDVRIMGSYSDGKTA
ncbi:MAG: hypothetical protein WCQ83_06000, partial [Endomicrobiia bacterium]